MIENPKQSWLESCLPLSGNPSRSLASRSETSNQISHSHPLSPYNKKAIPAATAPTTPFTTFAAPALVFVASAAVPVDVPVPDPVPVPELLPDDTLCDAALLVGVPLVTTTVLPSAPVLTAILDCDSELTAEAVELGLTVPDNVITLASPAPDAVLDAPPVPVIAGLGLLVVAATALVLAAGPAPNPARKLGE